MMVIPSNTPNTRWVNAIQMPPMISQIRFMRVERQPGADGLNSMVLPNGHKASMASLKA